MNILPEQPETISGHPTTPVTNPNIAMRESNVRHGLYNVHNSDSIKSFDDNTKYPSCETNDLGKKSCRRNAVHHSKTISNFIEHKRNIENEIHRALDDDGSNMESVASDKSETDVKAPYDDPVNLRTTRTKRANKQYVQHGDDNIMFVFEPIKSSSMDYYKQIGNKNIMVHVNVSSNQCQLLDQNDGIIPLDTNGEVWLEIKRRSRVRGEREGTDSPTREPCNLNPYVDIPNCTSDINRGRRSPTEHTDIKYRRSAPTENTDSLGTLSDYLEDDGDHYSTISILEGSDDLNIRFGKYSDDSELGLDNLDNLSKSQIWSHKKVLDFLSDEGNDFDVTIHDWEYKKESVYSYIPSMAIDQVSTGFYQQVGMGTIEEDPVGNEDLKDLYSKPKKFLASPTSPTDPNKRPLPKVPTQNIKLDDATSGPSNECERKPTIYPRTKKKADVSKETDVHQEKTRTNLSLLKISEAGTPPPQLPLRSPTSPQQVVQSPRTPQERRPLRLPPKPGSTIKENLDQFTWYHGKLEQGSGKHILMNQENGSFLVRDSQGKTDNHKYTIEFRDGQEFKKLMIVKTDDKYHFSESNSKTFDSVVGMVEAIIDTGLEVKDTDTNCWKIIKVKPAAKH